MEGRGWRFTYKATVIGQNNDGEIQVNDGEKIRGGSYENFCGMFKELDSCRCVKSLNTDARL